MDKAVTKLLNTRLRYLVVVVPCIIIVLFGMAYKVLEIEIENSLLHEKFIEKQQSVDLIASQIDAYVAADADWGIYNYEVILSEGLAQVDAQAFTYAALYDAHLENISARTPSYSSAFEPLEDIAFADTVLTTEYGEYVMPYTPDGDATRDMHIYYRWIPTDSELEGRYLAIVAVSKYSIQSTLPHGVWTLPIAIGTIATMFITASVWLLCYLGKVYISRKGEKWWGDED